MTNPRRSKQPTPTQPRIAVPAIREASSRDVPRLLPLMAVFNRGEQIAFRPRKVESALRRLLREPALGVVLIANGAAREIAGYVVVSYGYDLEFAGRDAFVTELFVAPEQRRRGTARALLQAVIARVQKEGVNALHLVVRPENRVASELYEQLGFRTVPRVMMTRVLSH